VKTVTPADAEYDRDLDGQTAVFDFSPVATGLQGYVWHFPCLENGARAMDRGVYDCRVHAGQSRADLKAILGEALRGLGDGRKPSAMIGHPVRCFSEDAPIAQPNVLLIGDAAGVDPALGEGISPSLDYGDFAANTLIDAFERQDFSLADVGTRLLAHPVGRSLTARARLARATYAGGPDILGRANQLVADWLG